MLNTTLINSNTFKTKSALYDTTFKYFLYTNPITANKKAKMINMPDWFKSIKTRFKDTLEMYHNFFVSV